MSDLDIQPAADLDYRIVVPSRGRPENMATVRSLLPTATILVDESEHARYALCVPETHLDTHPGKKKGISGLPKVFNWILDNYKEETIVEADDDLQAIRVWNGEGANRLWSRLTNPADILQIIENGVRIARDLDITAFGWAKSGNAAFLKLDQKPIAPAGLIANVFGVRGAARKRHYDPKMIGRASVDWTLRTLLEDRFVMLDKRVFFDCGTIFGGSGGNAGIVTEEKFREATKHLREKWGAHVRFGGNTAGMSRNKKLDAEGNTIARKQGDRQVSMVVRRSNPAATR